MHAKEIEHQKLQTKASEYQCDKTPVENDDTDFNEDTEEVQNVNEFEDTMYSDDESIMDVDLPSMKKLEDADPETSINSSKWAPYDKATMMKLDENESENENENEDQVCLPTMTTKLPSRRSLIKNNQSRKQTRTKQNFDLDLNPVIPPPTTSMTARKGQ
ncbi:hypothetical protein K492DRAFT_202468 [Lichtheimia hyalospora FSU 10163]|nr:hypothetical protein K492DRAFT_202468 [Lichtheimia hyalospora FSU 10163]